MDPTHIYILRQFDPFLMDQFHAHGFQARTMHILNKCRMNLHVIPGADIAKKLT